MYACVLVQVCVCDSPGTDGGRLCFLVFLRRPLPREEEEEATAMSLSVDDLAIITRRRCSATSTEVEVGGAKGAGLATGEFCRRGTRDEEEEEGEGDWSTMRLS